MRFECRTAEPATPAGARRHGNEATHALSGETDLRVTKGEDMAKMMAKLMNQKVGGKRRFTIEPEVSEKPCKPLDRRIGQATPTLLPLSNLRLPLR